jgi:hypothetical protein
MFDPGEVFSEEGGVVYESAALAGVKEDRRVAAFDEERKTVLVGEAAMCSRLVFDQGGYLDGTGAHWRCSSRGQD